MQRTKSIATVPECRNGCLRLIHLLVLHLTVAQAIVVRVPAPVLLAISVYLTGLIVVGTASAAEMSAALPIVSHDAITRMLGSGWWTRRLLLSSAVALTNRLGPGWLILDDVLIAKPFASAIAFCCWDYDHATRRTAFGLRLVVLVWCNGSVTIPLGFFIWQKDPQRVPRRTGKRRGRKPKRRPPTSASVRRTTARRHRTASGSRYRSKNELACALVWEAVRAGCPAKVITFDNWYASRHNTRLFTRLGLCWVTKLKSNTKVLFDGQRLTVAELSASVPKANYHYYSAIRARARSFDVTAFGATASLTVVKDDSHVEGGHTKYLVTTITGLTTLERVEWYRRRWPIECFFRDCKQLLSLGGCHARSPHPILTHLVLVCLAYVVLQLFKSVGPIRQVSVNRSQHALAALRVLVIPNGAGVLVRLMASGRFEPVDLAHLLLPVRTRLSDPVVPRSFEFP